MSRLVQLTGGTEELWEFPDDIKDEQIEQWYQEYREQEEVDMFEEFLEDKYPHIKCERLFVHEIYV